MKSFFEFAASMFLNFTMLLITAFGVVFGFVLVLNGYWGGIVLITGCAGFFCAFVRFAIEDWERR